MATPLPIMVLESSQPDQIERSNVGFGPQQHRPVNLSSLAELAVESNHFVPDLQVRLAKLEEQTTFTPRRINSYMIPLSGVTGYMYNNQVEDAVLETNSANRTAAAAASTSSLTSASNRPASNTPVIGLPPSGFAISPLVVVHKELDQVTNLAAHLVSNQ
jgi:hypothetical protein